MQEGAGVRRRVLAEDFGLMLNVDLNPEKYRALGLRISDPVFVSPKSAKIFEPDYSI